MPLARHMLVAVSERLYTLHKTRQHADYQANGHYSSDYRRPVKQYHLGEYRYSDSLYPCVRHQKTCNCPLLNEGGSQL